VRRITRNVTLGLLVVVVLLLALGALPSLLQSGDPYYAEATAAEAPDGVVPIDGANLSEQRFPYTYGAVSAADGGTARSTAYYRGPFGIKETFTHSVFDERDVFRQRYASNMSGDAVFVTVENVTYRVTVVQP